MRQPRSSRRLLASAVALVTALVLLPACVVAPRPVAHPHHHHARVVVIQKGHVHSARCGHYLHRGRWFHLRGHVHGARCGHVAVRGVWRLR